MRKDTQAIRQQVEAVLAPGFGAAAEAARAMHMDMGWPAWSGAGLPWHGVHEAFGTLDTATARLPAMSMALHMAWRLVHQTHQAPESVRVFWVGRQAWPHPRSLLGALRGLRGGWRQRLDARLWHASVLVDAGGLQDRLWATEMSLQAPGAALVVADGAGMNLTATRRLQLAATACPVLLLRPCEEARVPSSALVRWRVEPRAAEGRAAWQAHAFRTRSGLPSAWLDAPVSWHAWWEHGDGATPWEGVLGEGALASVSVTDHERTPPEPAHGTHAGDPAALVACRPDDPIAPQAGGLAA